MASRAFTGWTFIQPIPLDPYGRFPSEFIYKEEDHDDGEKTFLGHTAGSTVRTSSHSDAAAGDREVHIAASVQLLRG